MGATLAVLIATCAPHVHPTTMRALVAVESAGHPFAVSINRPLTWAAQGVLLPVFEPPRSRAEAERLVASLHAAGYSTSIGLAQINSDHLSGWRLPLAALLDPCTNLALAERVLLDCAASYGERPAVLPQLLSCFNSGNASTGIRNGYVARVRAAALRIATFPVQRSSSP